MPYYSPITDNSQDVYRQMVAGISNATQGLQTLGAGGLEQARTANERAYQDALLQAQRAYARKELEDQRKYTEEQYQKRREEGKQDTAEAQIQQLRFKVTSLGGDPSMMTPAEMGAYINQKGIENEIEANRTKTRAQLEDEYRVAGGMDEPGRWDTATLSLNTAVAKQAQQNMLAASNEQDQIRIAQGQPQFAGRKEQLADLLLQREALVTQAVAPMPDFNKQLSQQDTIDISKAMADDPAVIDIMNKLPDGKARMLKLRAGDFRAAATGMPMDVASNYFQAMQDNRSKLFDYIANGKTNSGERLNYTAGVQAYMQNLRELPERLKAIDAQINRMETEGEGKPGEVQYGKALRALTPAERLSLVNGAHDRFLEKQKMPGTGGKAGVAGAGGNGPTAGLPAPRQGTATPGTAGTTGTTKTPGTTGAGAPQASGFPGVIPIIAGGAQKLASAGWEGAVNSPIAQNVGTAAYNLGVLLGGGNFAKPEAASAAAPAMVPVIPTVQDLQNAAGVGTQAAPINPFMPQPIAPIVTKPITPVPAFVPNPLLVPQ